MSEYDWIANGDWEELKVIQKRVKELIRKGKEELDAHEMIVAFPLNNYPAIAEFMEAVYRDPELKKIQYRIVDTKTQRPSHS